MMIDRRNKRSVQIFFLLITFLVCSGVFFWYYSHPEDDVPDYFPPEVKEHQKTEREAALEKVRQLQQNGLENAAAETFYDDQSKKSISGNPDNSGYENARILFQKLNTTIVQESPLNENGEKMTADSFYDEKLKQKQEEDKDFNQQKTSEEAENADHAVHPDPSVNEQHKQEAVQKTKTTSEKAESADPPVQPDPSANEQHKQETAQNSNTNDKSITKDEKNAFDVIPKNDTASLDIIGKSEAVQSWLAKKHNSRTRSLSEVESSLRVDQAAQMSARRNPKFEAVDPEIERLQNQVHQFKFVQ